MCLPRNNEKHVLCTPPHNVIHVLYITASAIAVMNCVESIQFNHKVNRCLCFRLLLGWTKRAEIKWNDKIMLSMWLHLRMMPTFFLFRSFAKEYMIIHRWLWIIAKFSANSSCQRWEGGGRLYERMYKKLYIKLKRPKNNKRNMHSSFSTID